MPVHSFANSESRVNSSDIKKRNAEPHAIIIPKSSSKENTQLIYTLERASSSERHVLILFSSVYRARHINPYLLYITIQLANISKQALFSPLQATLPRKSHYNLHLICPSYLKHQIAIHRTLFLSLPPSVRKSNQ